MESTMEDAKRAMEIVERKLMEKDYVGAKKFINNAHNLFPNLDDRWKTMIDVYISASNEGESEADWYGVLGVDSLADDEIVKKNYKQLALLLHPDKNKCYGAEGAFKLVSEAWCLLSDKVQRASYDQRRKSKEAKIEIQKPPNPYKPTKATKEENSLNNMECNKEEPRRAMDIAERKLSENDYNGAKKFINKAQNLYPELDGLKQVLMMIDVYLLASNGGKEADWYGILGVDPLADDEVVKKQYKKLALLLHPDKNKFNGAKGAFKLVREAWFMLSDKGKRTTYDQRRKSKEAKTGMQKQPNQHNPASSGMEKPPNPCKAASSNGNQNARDSVDPSVGGRSNKLARWIVKRLNYLHKRASSSGNQNARDGVDPSVGDRSNKLARWIKKRLNLHKPASSNGKKNARDHTYYV
ncbi:DnaJ domain [Arabidopsis thaliana x Arabidopsis arenosa]|uniref:DnaJ domain n=1 Tax=Arabidopsis thaliana x Arabidopsis arenosa TaxID=1240361 RepID=A0A8T1Y9G8_9BRAS|nr:DnaJ domain [Arabidopsis thaliana x Arabidopsis arenosa]